MSNARASGNECLSGGVSWGLLRLERVPALFHIILMNQRRRKIWTMSHQGEIDEGSAGEG